MSDGPPETITARQLNRTTLLRQSLLDRSNEDAVTAIGRLAGLQAQYANSPYVALWSRLAGFAIGDLERALDERTVIKASVMRGTLHLVATRDYPALSVASSAARIASWRPSASRLGVETGELHRRLLEFAHDPRSIAEMETELEKILPDDALAGKVPSGARHVAFRMAEAHGWLVHVPPSGYWNSFAKSRYVDAGVWIPDATAPDADDGAARGRRTISGYLRPCVRRGHRQMGRTATAAQGAQRPDEPRRPGPHVPWARWAHPVRLGGRTHRGRG